MLSNRMNRERRSVHSNYARASAKRDNYTVGWVCALPLERAAAEAMLDYRYQDDNDTMYTLGRIGDHDVVIACLPAGQTGTNAAAAVAAKMMSTFQKIRFGLMVGIGGGVPSSEVDIRLGDVVVSQPGNGNGGVVQYDFGKTRPGEFEQTGFLNAPPPVLLSALSKLQAEHAAGNTKLSQYLSMVPNTPVPPRESMMADVLFESSYVHVPGPTCDRCSKENLVSRKPRNQEIAVHYGTIASGNQVMKDGITRDKLSSTFGRVLCFEMEAAGLMNSFPCLVIRGVCDYADSHKNKVWQRFAAASAAAYAKEILTVIPATEVEEAPVVDDAIKAEMLQSDIELAIDNVDLRHFFSMLPSINQEKHVVATPSQDCEGPAYYWILRNADFEQWNNSGSSRILWLTGPLECGIRKAASHILYQEMNKAPKTQRCVLYYFCSTAVVGKSSLITFIATLVRQLVSWSPEDSQKSIAQTFLRSLLSDIVKTDPPNGILRYFSGDSDSHIKNLLRAPVDSLWSALWAIMPRGQSPELSIVIDGIEHVREQRKEFIQGIRSIVEDLKRTSKMKILLTSGLEADTTEIFNDLPRIEYDKERKECLSSLLFNNTRFDKITEASKGTFGWLWDHPEYKQWSNPSTSRLLLIQGKPGSGKSTLTKYFNEHFLEQEPDAHSAIVARFFYSYRDGNLQRSHYNMLQCLLHDILRQDYAFFYHHFQTEYRSQPRHGARVDWEYESLKSVLKSLRDYLLQRPLYLIIDAVDESEEDDRLSILKLLFELCSGMQHGVVKVFVASRPVAQLDVRQKKIDNIIRLQDETVDDISCFARSMLDDLQLTHLLAKATKHIIDNADGVFLWVKLVGDELKASIEYGESEDSIFQRLERLPTELDDFYRLMFMRLTKNKPHVPDSITMFQLILWAARPLTVDELLHAVGIVDSSSIDPPSDESFERHIPTKARITYCGGNFLEIKKPNGKEIVQVMHQTVREFFLTAGVCVADSEFRMSDKEAHICMSKICIQYLTLCTATLRRRPPATKLWTTEHFDDYANYLDKRPFANYALCFLEHHMHGCGRHTSVVDLTVQLTKELIDGPASPLVGNLVSSLLGDVSQNIEHRSAAVEFRIKTIRAAVRKGFPSAVEILLSAGTDVNSKCEKGRTVLSEAAERGHQAVAKVVLARKDVLADLKDEDGQTPLSWAARQGQEAVVKLLVDRNDVETDSKDRNKRTPLSWAARQGQEAVVKLLVDRDDVEVDSKDKDKQTPLSWAARQGQEAVVKLLVDRNDVEADSKDRNKRTPLSWAAWQGQNAIVRLLLGRNWIQVSSDHKGRRSLLSWRAAQLSKVALRLLVGRNDIEADSRDKDGRTPLSRAAEQGHQEVVKLLLACSEVKVNSRDRYGRTPLSWAAIKGQKAIVELLIDCDDVEADAEDNSGRTPLSLAAQNGCTDVESLLLSRSDLEADSRDSALRETLLAWRRN